MKKIEKLKAELIEKVKPHNPCTSEYKRALSASTEDELLKVIFDNLGWCSGHKVISDAYFKKFTPKAFLSSGIANTGQDNKGFANAGFRNAGHANAGHANAGNYNAGFRNAGHANAGNDNAGHANAGHANAGNDNAGNYNAGFRNAGHANAGNDNAGAFNSAQSKYVMFNKPSNWTYEDFTNSRAFALLKTINTTLWIPSDRMTNEEKEKFPYHKTTRGYNRMIGFKEAFTNAWHNWNEENRQAFITLPNFDAAVFEEITGVKI